MTTDLALGDAGSGTLAVVDRDSGVMALAMMGEAEFEARLSSMKLGQERVRRIQRELMIGPTPESPEGEDYGVIPGTKKPTLLKPGAEKICQAYGLVPTFEREWKYGDGITAPHLRVEMTCYLHRGDKNGPIVGQGVGASNSWEKKHRYRNAQRACPSCGVEGALLRSKDVDEDGDRGWFCWGKKGGCGAKFAGSAPSIMEQHPGQVENPDPYEVENTLLKMSAKRAQVDAVLRTTATSGLFTQDVEDGAPPAAPDAQPTQAQPRPAQQAQRQAAPAPAQAQAQHPAGTLPKWDKPCPRCGKTGAVIVSKQKAGMYHCWAKAARVAGCSYDFSPADAARHASAREERGEHSDAEPGSDA